MGGGFGEERKENRAKLGEQVVNGFQNGGLGGAAAQQKAAARNVSATKRKAPGMANTATNGNNQRGA